METRVLTEDDHPLPRWIKQFDPKPKRKVASTDGHDGRSLVSVVDPDDFAAMIRMFVALKVTGMGLMVLDGMVMSAVA